MTPESQRIAIAEACGWEHSVCSTGSDTWFNGSAMHRAYCESDLPDYLNDLNDMHEAEKYLRPGQYVEYIGLLCKNTNDKNDAVITSVALFHATAAQRAEAFLKTIGKYTAPPTTNDEP